MAMKHYPHSLLSWKRNHKSCSYWSKASVLRKNLQRFNIFRETSFSLFSQTTVPISSLTLLKQVNSERDAWITFIRCFEPQQVADTVCLEEEPHLVVCANNEIRDCGACQAVKINKNK